MKRASAIMVMVGLFLATLFSLPAFADKKPEVTIHTAKYMDRSISIDVQWQAENPVTLITVAAGSEVKTINVGESGNRRVSGTFTGEANVILNAMPGFNQDSMSYTIQIEDDLKQKSRLVTGRVKIPTGMPGHPDDQWAQEKLPGTPGGSILDKTAAVRSRHQGTPLPAADPNATVATAVVTTPFGTAQPAAATPAAAVPQAAATAPAAVAAPLPTGFVMVVITPQQAADIGAMWRIDGGQWQRSGTMLPGISTGMHIIDYSDIAAWTRPLNQTINVDAGLTAQISGVYIQQQMQPVQPQQ